MPAQGRVIIMAAQAAALIFPGDTTTALDAERGIARRGNIYIFYQQTT
jgi:hypothetical protein